jgi:FkbM family methyltransferase
MSHKKWHPNGYLSTFILKYFEDGYRGHAIDVGASDGVSTSSTYVLEIPHDWTVLCVEANPEFAAALKQSRTWVEMCACGSASSPEAEFHINTDNPESFSALKITDHPLARSHRETHPSNIWKTIKVPVKTLDELIAKWEFPKLDVLCIDTEGTELDILKGCDLKRWMPKVIVTECWDRYGPIDLYLDRLGYEKTARNVHNDIFIRTAP